MVSCSGSTIKDNPADMYINCSAFSAFMISKGLPGVEGDVAVVVVVGVAIGAVEVGG